MDINSESHKTGYLHQNFRFFHLKDKKNQEYGLHYHEFNKIFIFLSGNVTYTIEGKNYHLKPWDILLISSHDLHRPIIDPNQVYERIIIYVNPEFIHSMNSGTSDVTKCFRQSSESSYHLIRPDGEVLPQIQQILYDLEESLSCEEFGSDIVSNSYFMQLMVQLNRIFNHTDYHLQKNAMEYDRRTESILRYINQHLDEDLSNQTLSEKFYISKYHMMHTFKVETGYTLHSYVQQKRLMASAELIKKGVPVMKAAQQCGFKDYSTYYRAFQKFMGRSPKEIHPS